MKVSLNELHRRLKVMARNLSNGSLNRAGGAAYSMEELGSFVAQAEVRSSELQRLTELRPIEAWTPEDHDVLWWTLSPDAVPYVGSPHDDNWPTTSHYTHWTPIPKPTQDSDG